MAIWPFKKKTETPPFELYKGYYMIVLAPEAPLPPILQLLNPQGSNGAVKGFGVPMTPGAPKDVLNEPLAPGTYALASPDKLTVLQVDVFRRSDVPSYTVPTDPALLERAELTGPRLARAQAAAWYVNVQFKGYSPKVYESVQFLLDLMVRLAETSDGLIADPLGEFYRLPGELKQPKRLNPLIDFREVGSVKAIRAPDGIWVSTRGLRKFLLPEYEMYGLPDELADVAARMVASAAQQALIGRAIRAEETAFSEVSPLVAKVGTRERAEWGDRPTIEFLDVGGHGAAHGAAAWKAQGN